MLYECLDSLILLGVVVEVPSYRPKTYAVAPYTFARSCIR